MQIWVDADACPVAVKEILFRASQRWQCRVTLVANQMLRTPAFHLITAIQVPRGFDVADDYLVQHAVAGDIGITNDIPLAAQLVQNGVYVLSTRGEQFSAQNIGQRLAMRNWLEELRNTGVAVGGPSAFSQADRREFANSLDSLLRRLTVTLASE